MNVCSLWSSRPYHHQGLASGHFHHGLPHGKSQHFLKFGYGPMARGHSPGQPYRAPWIWAAPCTVASARGRSHGVCKGSWHRPFLQPWKCLAFTEGYAAWEAIHKHRYNLCCRWGYSPPTGDVPGSFTRESMDPSTMGYLPPTARNHRNHQPFGGSFLIINKGLYPWNIKWRGIPNLKCHHTVPPTWIDPIKPAFRRFGTEYMTGI